MLFNKEKSYYTKTRFALLISTLSELQKIELMSRIESFAEITIYFTDFILR